MAKKSRPSTQKREREFEKRRREQKKAEKAAQKRERREMRKEPGSVQPARETAAENGGDLEQSDIQP